MLLTGLLYKLMDSFLNSVIGLQNFIRGYKSHLIDMRYAAKSSALVPVLFLTRINALLFATNNTTHNLADCSTLYSSLSFNEPLPLTELNFITQVVAAPHSRILDAITNCGAAKFTGSKTQSCCLSREQ